MEYVRVKAMTLAAVAGALLGLGSHSEALAQHSFLMMPDSAGDRVMKFDAVTGNLINPYFIFEGVVGNVMDTPVCAIQVRDEIWVADSILNKVLRFSGDGTSYLGDATDNTIGGVQNLRGIAYVNDVLYVCNGSGVYAGQVTMHDATGAVIGAINVGGSPFDVQLFNGELLVSNSSTDDIDRCSLDGHVLGKFVDSTGNSPLDFPEQISPAPDGTVVVGAFGAAADGIHRFSSAGAVLNFYDTAPNGGVRGVYQLPGGQILYTNGTGMHRFDPSTGSNSDVATGASGRYIELFVNPGCPADFDGDGTVDFFDYDAFVACFEGFGCPPGKSADFDGDGSSDFFDYDAFVAAFETPC